MALSKDSLILPLFAVLRCSHCLRVDYMMQGLAGCNREEVLAVMAYVGFTEDGKAKPFHPVNTLSGGWRMKLALVRAMLQYADVLLLDAN